MEVWVSKAIKGKKKEVYNEDLNKFITEVFEPAVINFNLRCGNTVDVLETVEQAIDALVNQSKRVLEEELETLSAYLAGDVKERLDGVVDSMVTSIYQVFLWTQIVEKFGEDEVLEEIAALDFDERNLLTITRSLYPTTLESGLGEAIQPKRLMLAMELIVANNNLKYTTDIDVANDWIAKTDDRDLCLKETVVDGVSYYCLRRISDGKIMKPYNFIPVKLEFA